MASVLNTATNATVRGLIDTALTVGRSAAHSFAPDEIEYYLCSLELFTSDKERVGFLSFSVMPTDIMENKTSITSITKTQYGVVDTFTNGFIPRDISIRGTFGKKFRVVNIMRPDGFSSANFFNNAGILEKGYDLWESVRVLKNTIPSIHSGYGLTKILKRMVERSYELDDSGRPHLLLFTNHALNTSYVVEVLQDSYSMSQDQNTIWQYSLEMKAIAPASAIIDTKKIGFIVREGVNAAATAVASLLKDTAKQLVRNIF